MVSTTLKSFDKILQIKLTLFVNFNLSLNLNQDFYCLSLKRTWAQPSNHGLTKPWSQVQIPVNKKPPPPPQQPQQPPPQLQLLTPLPSLNWIINWRWIENAEKKRIGWQNSLVQKKHLDNVMSSKQFISKEASNFPLTKQIQHQSVKNCARHTRTANTGHGQMDLIYVGLILGLIEDMSAP